MVAGGSSRRSKTDTARSSSTSGVLCTKNRNIQRHLPKRYRKQAHHLFATALEQNSYKDAKKMLQGVRALASRHQRVGGRLTPRGTRGVMS